MAKSPHPDEISVNLSAVSGNDLLNTDIINVIRANYDIVMRPILEQYNVGVSNGWAILPILAGASQYFTTWLMNGKQTAAQRNNPQAQNQKMMNYIFPLSPSSSAGSTTARLPCTGLRATLYDHHLRRLQLLRGLQGQEKGFGGQVTSAFFRSERQEASP